MVRRYFSVPSLSWADQQRGCVSPPRHVLALLYLADWKRFSGVFSVLWLDCCISIYCSSTGSLLYSNSSIDDPVVTSRYKATKCRSLSFQPSHIGRVHILRLLVSISTLHTHSDGVENSNVRPCVEESYSWEFDIPNVLPLFPRGRHYR